MGITTHGFGTGFFGQEVEVLLLGLSLNPIVLAATRVPVALVGI